LLLKEFCLSLILPSSSGVPALPSVSPTDKRFGNVRDWCGIVRVSPVLSCGILEADRDLGMGAIIIIEGLSIGVRNGIEVALLASAMPVEFLRGGGIWVFLGSTNIWKTKRQAKASFPELCKAKSIGTWSEWRMPRRESNEFAWRGKPDFASSIAPRSPALNRQLS
jgi:hypothetical protein